MSTPDSPLSAESGECRKWDEAPFTKWNMLEPPISSTVVARKSAYKRAGLSSDCSSVCLYNEREVAVYSICVPETVTEDSRVESSEKKFGRDTLGEDTRIWDVAVSKNYLVVSTFHNVLVFRHTSDPLEDPLETFPSGNWHFSGLAIYETDARLAILIGKTRNTGSVIDGQISAHTCSLVNSSDRPIGDSLHFEEPRIISIPDHDYPKRIGFGQDEKTISCITGILNTVLIWVADGDLSSCIVPFVVSNRYTPVRFLEIMVSIHPKR